ncbi:polysaccharide lyase family 8 protein [Crucibulum laeve]|uniref:Polysaccharide lyase family 8 protein n=1 Tax=Crucibulum laeve TaxID=68775 RepID=A0A5C3M8U5_9AGAR|nr:polysaccharide lyase family 8 protein [Crucibulum laeve]
MKISALFPVLSLALCVYTADVDIARERRLSVIVGSTTGATSIPTWLATLGSDGKWPDNEINYTAGCDAQTGSWPAQSHWSRINTLAAAYHGGLKNAAQYTGDPVLRNSVSLAMQFWFSNDFMVPACIDLGGTDSCPCGTPGFWNKNWNSNIILIPGWVGQVCLLLGDTLTVTELEGCQKITERSYATFGTGINGVGAITGANTLDIASIGVDRALLSLNTSLLIDAFDKVHGELAIRNDVKADGIRADGSFGQHAGILYNGNYGEFYILFLDNANDIYNLEIIAGGTQFQATSSSRSAFATLLMANQWMIFRNIATNVLHWDFSVLGRIISLPTVDNQATANLKTNLTQIQVLGQLWDSAEILNVFNTLSLQTEDANVGPLQGNRMFYTNDYMVHRGNGYRTQNTECTNSQNPFGFHLSDGAVYNYLRGDEYEDIFAAWDWNLIPGTTVDYNATALSCSGARKTGTQRYVGGVSDGEVGIAAMHYQNPSTKSLEWQKAWFFLKDDVQFVMITNISSKTSSPVFSVLDQRRLQGDIFVNGVKSGSGNYTSATSLWHGGVGYTFNVSSTSIPLSIQYGSRTGSWQTIGTSHAPPAVVDLFTAWLSHSDPSIPVSYSVYPGTTFSSFQQKSQAPQFLSVRNDGSISALLDASHNIAMLVFWTNTGGSASVPSVNGNSPLIISSSGTAAIILYIDSWKITVSDPTQTLTALTLNFTLGPGKVPAAWGTELKTWIVDVDLPGGGLAGSSTTQALF